jgi:hypothetical protein
MVLQKLAARRSGVRPSIWSPMGARVSSPSSAQRSPRGHSDLRLVIAFQRTEDLLRVARERRGIEPESKTPFRAGTSFRLADGSWFHGSRRS